MNKIEYRGVTLLDIDSVNATVTKTQKQVSSDEVTSIKIVNDYPPVEEQGVLYIKVQSSNNNNNNA